MSRTVTSTATFEVVERGIVPCQKCGRAHDLLRAENEKTASWADPEDGHPYHRMSAEQIVRRFELVPRGD